MRLLFLGDLVGRAGRGAVIEALPPWATMPSTRRRC
jgi:calcineurin-like phosphoesterase